MDRTETLSKHGKYSNAKLRKLGPGSKAHPYDPTITLKKPKFILKAILQSLAEGDYEAVMEIWRSHLDVMNRTRAAKALGISRQYVHKILNRSTQPSLQTFTQYMGALEEATGTSLHISLR
ncbi:MAG: helix-turn-helix transcriptional regulator [Elusimicrobia bacterium]|nr:helix-turn-helix transcriptional regulator [Elusimicrobiota bacterium]